jgi:flagellar basal-body rod protein FlgC
MRYVRILSVWVAIFSSLAEVMGCAAPATRAAANVAVLHEADPAAADLIAYLRLRHVPVATSADGLTRIEPGAATQKALIAYMNVARLKMDTCAGNIANQNTTRDSGGKANPYRRRVVEVTSDGEAKVGLDDSPFQKRYEPASPDAGADGMVLLPNVDLAVEGVICTTASREYDLAGEILRRIDPTIVISGIDLRDPFEESDVEGR